MNLQEIQDALVRAPQIGPILDVPEGMRYVKLSVTLVDKIVAEIDDILERASQDMDSKAYVRAESRLKALARRLAKVEIGVKDLKGLNGR